MLLLLCVHFNKLIDSLDFYDLVVNLLLRRLFYYINHDMIWVIRLFRCERVYVMIFSLYSIIDLLKLKKLMNKLSVDSSVYRDGTARYYR